MGLFTSHKFKGKVNGVKYKHQKDFWNAVVESENAKKTPQQQAPVANPVDEKAQLDEMTNAAKMKRKEGRQEGYDYAQEVMNRKAPGMDPNQRRDLQYAANKQIQRSMQSANRHLLGDQGQRGIRPQSGVGYAQQRDLQKMGLEAQGTANRDLDKLNSDIEMKQLAQMFGIEQGEAAQQQLDRQIALDELRVSDERKRQQFFEQQFSKLFNRI